MGKAYLVAYSSSNILSEIKEFKGTLIDGDQDLPVTSSHNKWNLLGNPYPCALDWSSAGIEKSLVSGSAMYVWDQSLNSGLGGYRTHNGTLGIPAGTTPCIPAMNGFFVHATAAGNVSVDISNDDPLVKCDTGFYKDITVDPSELVRLSLKRNNFSDEILIIRNPSSSNQYDTYFDAQKLFVYNDSVPEIYSLSDNFLLSINQFQKTPYELPFNIHSEIAGEVIIEAKEIQGFEDGTSIVLEDRLYGKSFDLRNQPQLSFSIVEGENADRFFLYFESLSRICQDRDIRSDVQITCRNNTLYIKDNHARTGVLRVLSIHGQELLRFEMPAQTDHEINISSFKGAFLVNIVFDEKSQFNKVLINY